MMPNDNQYPINESNLNKTLANTGSVEYVTELKPNDILLGRGAPIINYEGNVRFRALVQTKKGLYNNTCRHSAKDEIAREIIVEIQRRKGRFLTKIESHKQLNVLGIPPGKPAWTNADDDIILEKVKQALRDKKPERRKLNMGSAATNMDASNTAPDGTLLLSDSIVSMAGLETSKQEAKHTSSLTQSEPPIHRSMYPNSISAGTSGIGNADLNEMALRSVQQQRQVHQESHLSHLLQRSNVLTIPAFQEMLIRNNLAARTNNSTIVNTGRNPAGISNTNNASHSEEQLQLDYVLRALANRGNPYNSNSSSQYLAGNTNLYLAAALQQQVQLQQQYNNIEALRNARQLSEVQRQVLLGLYMNDVIDDAVGPSIQGVNNRSDNTTASLPEILSNSTSRGIHRLQSSPTTTVPNNANSLQEYFSQLSSERMKQDDVKGGLNDRAAIEFVSRNSSSDSSGKKPKAKRRKT